jgi:heme o synthase
MATEGILPATAVPLAPRARTARLAVLSDYWALTKPEINLLVAITTATSFCLGSRAEMAPFPWLRLLHTVAGTMLVASGAGTLNQWMERRLDGRMQRTARRPLPAGRIAPGRAHVFGVLLSLAGVACLLAGAGLLASLLATGTLLGYLFLYTPAKRLTPLCTLVGAVPGALPPLIGWAAARGRLDPEAWMLFAIVFLWQFPHFMAIAWLYRADYDRAGFRVLPQGDAREPFVMSQTLSTALVLPVASVLPLVAGHASPVYLLSSAVLGVAFADCAMRFALEPSNSGARQLLLASIVYLPLQFALVVLAGPRWLPR